MCIHTYIYTIALCLAIFTPCKRANVKFLVIIEPHGFVKSVDSVQFGA